ncbi:MAG: PAS domain-containing protein [Proteobacteria bacterium]|nr:PAS domain-containing protein [Pseudomonadota bacterium]
MTSMDLKIKTGIGIIVAFFVLQGFLFYSFIQRVNLSKYWVIHTHNVIAAIDNLQLYINQAEITQLKNSIIRQAKNSSQTPPDSTSTSINLNSNTNVTQALKIIHLLTIDNIIQQEKLSDLQPLINLKKPKLNEINLKLKEMIQEEKRLLSIRNKMVNKTTKDLIVLLSFASFLNFITILVVIAMLNASRKALKKNEDRLNLAIKGTSDGLWDWEPNSRKVYFSDRFMELLGMDNSKESLTVEDFNKRIHPEDFDYLWNAVNNHLENRTPYNIEFRAKNKKGRYAWFQSRGQAIWDKSGKPIRMSGFITDITQKKEVENLKNEFVSTVSHELRTPLTSIKGSLGLVLAGTEGPLTQEMNHFLEIADHNCERLIILINDLLDIDKLEAGKLQFNFTNLKVKNLIEQSVELNKLLCEKRHIRLQIEQPLANAYVKADENRLIQVMTNLLSNAIKFSPKGGTIEISTQLTNTKIRVNVTDHGKGIAKEDIPLLFTKFNQLGEKHTTRQSGTGLGLYISKHIILNHKGKIDLELNNGTTFYFELPIIHEKELQHETTH